MVNKKSSKASVIAASFCFVLYVGLTTFQMLPEWPALSGRDQFALVKHLVVWLGIIAFLVARPQIGGWAALAWGVFVPFEKYLLLAAEFVQGTLGNLGALALLDEIKLLLLFSGTCLSGLVLYQLQLRKASVRSISNADADA